jgi:hypothetical protein
MFKIFSEKASKIGSYCMNPPFFLDERIIYFFGRPKVSENGVNFQVAER